MLQPGKNYRKNKNALEKYSQELAEEKEKLQDIFDIACGIKPNKPAGVFRIFLQEKEKNGEINNLNNGHEIWKELSEEEKEEYFTKSHSVFSLQIIFKIAFI